MNDYPLTLRFRPECRHDLDVLSAALSDLSFTDPAAPRNAEDSLLSALAPGHVDVTVESRHALDRLVSAMAAQRDGHRMWQTLDVADHYTGDAFEGEESGRYARLEALLGLETSYEDSIFMRAGDGPSGPA
ncbi:hypothetical protein [Paracoccus sp. ME4]|uniref:hypothetical protein n=1 Tax=Paracoccus sp. ME4 TaxID=3138066 RepID=UPI00398B4751